MQGLRQDVTAELRVTSRAGHLPHVYNQGYAVRPQHMQELLQRPVGVSDCQYRRRQNGSGVLHINVISLTRLGVFASLSAWWSGIAYTLQDSSSLWGSSPA
jgi:hypothetical protein